MFPSPSMSLDIPSTTKVFAKNVNFILFAIVDPVEADVIANPSGDDDIAFFSPVVEGVHFFGGLSK